jgi:hypothetical protein
VAEVNSTRRQHTVETAPVDRDKLMRRKAALWNERSSWDAHWKELGQNLLPRSGRFNTQDRNKGNKRHNLIYDNAGPRALGILSAGMMAGMTSPARPWFRLATSDPDMMKVDSVKWWLNSVTRLMLDICASSNLYNSLHQTYRELGCFGTAPMLVGPDFDNVIHSTPLTVGEYAVTANDRGQVDTLFREFEKPVSAVIREYGRDRVSQSVRTMYDNNQLDQYVPIVHAIEPRADRDTTKRDNKNMAFKSVYFERDNTNGTYLRESGFEDFPGVVPRWDVIGGDIYGSSPGMEALGDIKQLQQEQLRKSQAIDYMTKPPIVLPTAAKGQESDFLPGGVSYMDLGSNTGGTRSAFEVRLDLEHLLADIQDVRERIRGSFYADLFLMLSQANVSNMTATEVAERHEEKLLMLGPVLERLHNELLKPFIDQLFKRMLQAGIVPTPPQELQGMDLNVQFVSMLAQAQRAVQTNSIDRFTMQLGTLMAIKPEIADKFDGDAWVDTYSDMLGIDPHLITADDKVVLIRNQRADAQAKASAAQQGVAMADAAGKLGSVPTKGGASNAAADVMNQFSGYGSPGAENY